MDTPMTGSVLLELVSIYIDIGGFIMKNLNYSTRFISS